MWPEYRQTETHILKQEHIKTINQAPFLIEMTAKLMDSHRNLITTPNNNKKCHKHVTNAPKGIGLV